MNKTIGIPLVLVILLSAFALAGAPFLNITMHEIVYNNVTFAKNFYLEENVEVARVEGLINISHPLVADNVNETINDIYVKLVNVDLINQSANVTWQSQSGLSRYGQQITYSKLNNETTSYGYTASTRLNITDEWVAFTKDIDEDGSVDMYKVNWTHLFVNVSSEYETQYYELKGGDTSTSVSIENAGTTPVVINLSINISGSYNTHNMMNVGVKFATMEISGTANEDGHLNTTTDDLYINYTDVEREYIILYVPELSAGNFSLFSYNTTSSVVPPLDLNTSYFHDIYDTKVLAGEEFNITDTVYNVGIVNIENINITMRTMAVNITNSSGVSGPGEQEDNFTFSQLFYFPGDNYYDYSNVTTDTATYGYASGYNGGVNPREWYWIVNGSTMSVGSSFNISYAVRAPDTVPTSATYLAIYQTLQYTSNSTASNVTLGEVRASADIQFNETKRIVWPMRNESDNNVTWETIPTVFTTIPVNYTLENVTMWVTSTIDPNAQETGLNTTYEVNSQINNQNAWSATTPWRFNFTDASNGSNAAPPIIWIKPQWIIENADGQILNMSITRSTNETNFYFKYIYVIHGYWLEVYKNITANGAGNYSIFVQVYNRGTGHTPQNMTVTIYDFVPAGFTAYGMNPSPSSNTDVTGEFSGTSYYWDVGLRTNISTSFGPKGYESGLDQYNFTYDVLGVGDFDVGQLYIVGLDPRAVDGASASPLVSIVSGIASTSTEFIYMAVVIILIAINVGNFVLTSRINKKLDNKGRRFV